MTEIIRHSATIESVKCFQQAPSACSEEVVVVDSRRDEAEDEAGPPMPKLVEVSLFTLDCCSWTSGE